MTLIEYGMLYQLVIATCVAIWIVRKDLKRTKSRKK